MRRFLLDTGIAALHLDRKRGVFERAAVEVARGNRVGIAAPVLAELAFRAEGSPQRDRNVLRLRQALDVWKLWLVDTAAAFEYGRLAFELKTIGRPMGQNDIMIAAIALSLGNTTVVTMDTDLAAREIGAIHISRRLEIAGNWGNWALFMPARGLPLPLVLA